MKTGLTSLLFVILIALSTPTYADNILVTNNISFTGSSALYGQWANHYTLTDGNLSTGGQNPNYATPQWVIDLGPNASRYSIDSTDFSGHYQGTGNAVSNWTVEYSNDSSNWTAAVSNWNPGGPADQLISMNFSAVTGQRYWRFTMNSNSCSNGCWVDDFGLYGKTTANARLTNNISYTGTASHFGNWSPTHLTDGDASNSGGQNATGKPQWTIDLGPNAINYTINTTDFGGHYQTLGNAVTNWTVEYSNDSTNWTAAVSNWNPGGPKDQLINKTFSAITGQRYWRFTMNSNSCSNGCWVDEFGLWGTKYGRLTTGIPYTGSIAAYGEWGFNGLNSLTDRNLTSGGQNPNIAAPQWTIDFGIDATRYIINTTDFSGQYQGTGNAVTDWTVEYSNDNTNWTPAVSNWNPGGSPTQLINTTFSPVTGERYWRFTMNNNSCTNGCWVDDFGLWGIKSQLLTANATYTGSTALYGNWTHTRLTDRIPENGGQRPSITPQWTIDLGPTANYTVSMTDFVSYYQGTSNAVTSWTVEYSTDNTTWSTAVANWNPGGSRDEWRNATFSPVTGQRYWRFTMNSNGCTNGCWVDDFGLWGW